MGPARLLLLCASVALAQPEALEQFESKVRPVLIKNCVSCHGPAQQSSSLRVDSRDSLLRGGNRGPALIPGDPQLSPLLRAIRHDDLKMPIGKKLAPADIAALEQWVKAGAPWPAEKSATGPGSPGYYDKLRREHWAFQPIRRVPAKSIDELLPAPKGQADRPTLLRRLSFVLTGLPPTPLEVDLFQNDQAPGAYERQVDRLLRSPHFGEQWARHWMDLMRFAETFGNDWNYEINGAHHYRDYLIRAFNADVPYSQLVREHLAGDQLPTPRLNPATHLNESKIGTTSLRLGELGHDDCVRFRQIRTDVVDNQIDTLGKAFLGLTIACARCHDHKLDPIPTTDYYALYGVLTSSRMVMQSADLPSSHAAVKQRLAALKPQIRRELAATWRSEAAAIPRYLQAAQRALAKSPTNPADLAELNLDRLQSWLAELDQPNAPLEHPLSPLRKLQPDLYRAEQAQRQAYNREHFRPFPAWQAEGAGLLPGPSQPGEFSIAPSGPTALTGLYPAGLYTHLLSSRLDGALRSPLVPKDKKFVSFEVLGGQLGARRTILDNCMLSEDYQLLESSRPAWIKVPNRDDQPDLPYYIELVTKHLNPRIPDRPGRLKTTPEQLAAPNSYFGFVRAVLHDVDATPKPDLAPLLAVIPATPARYAAVISDAINAWEANRATDQDVFWLSWMLEKGLFPNQTTPTIREYRNLEALLAAPTTFQGMADLDPGYNVPILIGGDAERKGRVVPRGFVSLLPTVRPTRSGRLDVAESILSPTNPLTARVIVNRLWQHVFGRGLVATADNFGTYGEKPTNPDLLDHLATTFVDQGWSIKKHLRLLVTSQAFQAADRPVRRLEAEAIRDNILAVSGRLDRTLYGPSIQPHREEPKDYRKLHQGPLDGLGRRSIYTKVTRHEGSAFLETFDFPNPNVARGTRDVTNVPPQALALLNDPFVLDQAGVWADRLLAQPAPTAEARLTAMFRQALSRPPSASELERFLGLSKELASLHKVAPDKLLSSRQVWKDLAHSLFNLKEFLYLK